MGQSEMDNPETLDTLAHKTIRTMIVIALDRNPTKFQMIFQELRN